MLLAIDVGNTNTVLGLYRPGSKGVAPEMVANWRITTPTRQTTDEFGVLLRNLFGLHGLGRAVVGGIAISSGAPPLDSTRRKVCEIYIKMKPLFVEQGVKTGLPVLTDNPTEV